jgi:hypothetical protein
MPASRAISIVSLMSTPQVKKDCIEGRVNSPEDRCPTFANKLRQEYGGYEERVVRVFHVNILP